LKDDEVRLPNAILVLPLLLVLLPAVALLMPFSADAVDPASASRGSALALASLGAFSTEVLSLLGASRTAGIVEEAI
jgi:hypothetical protein